MRDAEMGFDLMARLDALGRCSDEGRTLTRLYLSSAHAEAVGVLRGWMQAAGLATRLDAAATLIGRLEGPPDARTLLIGSHIDTVRDAGRFDGNLGVLCGLAALDRLRREGVRLPFAVELLAFGDEEGVRFPVTMTGSRAAAGILPIESQLAAQDADGITLGAALRAFGGDPEGLAAAAYRPERVIGFIEVHIEQGPVLEQAGLALGVVSAINGARRFTVSVTGRAGHAGTVPMTERQDALAAACEMVVAVRQAALERPGAVNVIAGWAEFSVDVRASEDARRDDAVAAVQAAFAAVARSHRVDHAVRAGFSAPAVACTPALQRRLEAAAEALHLPVMRLPSGAGHDAMSMAALCPVAMLFVRCRHGISHHPAEAVAAADAEQATAVLTRTLCDLATDP